MRRKVLILAAALLSVLALSWLLRIDVRSRESRLTPTAGSSEPQREPAQEFAQLHTPTATTQGSDARSGKERIVSAPIDVAARASFNERARTFFAHASELPADERAREVQELEQDLKRLEQAGGLSAGETYLVRVGLIRETVPAGPQQEAQLKALQDRYSSETQRRLAATQLRPDPQFESYKVREGEIVSEVMSLEEIPDGLSRNEYLRRRLQSAREQLTPQ